MATPQSAPEGRASKTPPLVAVARAVAVLRAVARMVARAVAKTTVTTVMARGGKYNNQLKRGQWRQ